MPPAVTTSPIDRPFDRSSRLRSRRNGSKNTTIQPKSPFKLEIDLRPLGVFEGASRVNNNVPASPGTAVELPNRRSEPPTRWLWGRARSAATVDASLHHWSAGCIGAGCAGRGGQRLAPARAVLLAHSVQLTTRARCRGCGGARHEAEAELGAPTSQKATLAPVQVLGPAIIKLLVGRAVPYVRGG